MLKGFEGYYPPDFVKLWKEAVFVFDTNVLLDLYRYSPNSRKELLDILEGLDDRIWIPHQFFFEYHKNKVAIYDNIGSEYEALEKLLQGCRESTIRQLEKELARFKNRTGFVIDPRSEQADRIFEEILNDLSHSKEQHQSSLNDEPPEEKIAQLFAGRYSGPFDDCCLENIRQLAKERYKSGTPPGSSKDNKKDESDPDGDLIGWLQTIRYAKDEKKPIILVSNDGDWFLTHKGETKGPYPELLQEMYDKARVNCYIYKSSQFIIYAKDYLDVQVSDETIEEAEIREKSIAEQEYENSILDNSEEMITAEKLADYLSPVDELLRKGQPGQYDHALAAVVCGAVLEDALRRLCDRQIPQIMTDMPNGRSKALYTLIHDLQNANAFNRLKAQQLYVWAQIRNSAVHGSFDDFSRDNVEHMVKDVRNFLADYL